MTAAELQRSANLLKLVAVLFLVFDYGKLFEAGPPYDDPLGGPDLLPELAQSAAVLIGFLVVWGMGAFFRIFRDQAGRTGKLGWPLAIFGGVLLALGGAVYLPTRNALFWSLLILGNFITAFGLVMIGIDAVRRGYLVK